MRKKRIDRIKKKPDLEISKEFSLGKFEEIEKNVLKIIKKTNNSSKKH